MDELGSLLVGLALLILLAATSLRFGFDSRDGIRGRGVSAPRGIVRDAPPAAPERVKAEPKEAGRVVAAPAECEMAPCVV